MILSLMTLVGGVVMLSQAQIDPRAWMEQRPESAFIKDPRTGESIRFCSDWNPDFGFMGGLCCGQVDRSIRRRGIRCDPARSKESFCDEMTSEQVDWFQKDSTGVRPASRAFCGYNDGFLAWGKPLISTKENFIRLRNPQRCVHFGTDEMVRFLDWLGTAVGKEISTYLLVGDISAPRGGCLSGRGGRVGHASHTSGRDADIGFVHPKLARGPDSFSRQFDAAANLWLLKKMFANPFVCIRAVFLDHRHIWKLSREAQKQGDSEWFSLAPHIRHVRNHRNHFHVRIGDAPGPAGCNATSEPELASGGGGRPNAAGDEPNEESVF